MSKKKLTKEEIEYILNTHFFLSHSDWQWNRDFACNYFSTPGGHNAVEPFIAKEIARGYQKNDKKYMKDKDKKDKTDKKDKNK